MSIASEGCQAEGNRLKPSGVDEYSGPSLVCHIGFWRFATLWRIFQTGVILLEAGLIFDIADQRHKVRTVDISLWLSALSRSPEKNSAMTPIFEATANRYSGVLSWKITAPIVGLAIVFFVLSSTIAELRAKALQKKFLIGMSWDQMIPVLESDANWSSLYFSDGSDVCGLIARKEGRYEFWTYVHGNSGKQRKVLLSGLSDGANIKQAIRCPDVRVGFISSYSLIFPFFRISRDRNSKIELVTKVETN